ncbi:MAG: hypothetical protein ACRCYC_06275 [Paraclostridium sp.]|uniref:hypothetical protein n=1 Tax=Paraclostridium sp. TaxID=2023273 RepID=UPI003F377A90
MRKRQNIFYSTKMLFINLRKSLKYNNLLYKTNLYECDIVKVENIIEKSNFKIGIFKRDGWNNLDKLLKIIEDFRNKGNRENIVIILEEIAYSLIDYIELSEEPSYKIIDNIVGYIEVCSVYSTYMKEKEIVEILKSIYIPKVKIDI